jgi:protein SCO1/2
MKRRAFVIAAGAGVMALPFIPHLSTAPAWEPRSLTPAQRRRRAFPNVTLRTHEGQEVHFYDDLLKDKTVLFHFMYTQCKDGYCVPAVANLARVEKELKGRVGRDVFLYSITLDPRHDTPEVLKKHRAHFTKNPGWVFLTSDQPQRIDRLRRRLGYVRRDPLADADPASHVGHVTMGIEPLERWCSAPGRLRAATIASYLCWMEPNGERPTPWMLAGKKDRIRSPGV